MRANPKLDVEAAITELSVGEALVSLLDEKGRPNVVERAFILPPASKIGPISEDERRTIIASSTVFGHYEQMIDRESAYEKLKGRAIEKAGAGRTATAQAGGTSAAGAMGFAGTPDKILFVNLPVKCTLHIFTETGNLVRTIEHYGSGDEEWGQRTDSNQYVASGIYVLVVTNAADINGVPLDNQFVKFVIVR